MKKQGSSIMNNNPIDVHCHFFNVKYAFRELLEIAWRLANGNYPYLRDECRFSAGMKEPGRKEVFKPDLDYLLKYVASFFVTAVQNVEQNYRGELQSYDQGQWDFSAPLITVPLMMDIFFVLDDGSSLKNRPMMAGLPEDQPKRVSGATYIPGEASLAFTGLAAQLKAGVLQTFEQQKTAMKLSGTFQQNHGAAVGKELDNVIKEFQQPQTEEHKGAFGAMTEGTQMTRGFRKHLLDLQDLKRKNPDTVMPFLAVDPRRKGIKELVKAMILPGIFKGIKLYPPLGYLPSHPDLYAIYQLCLENNIPITTHCSPGGMKTMCKTIHIQSMTKDGSIVTKEVTLDNPAEFFAKPDNWLEILQNKPFSKLRINFAHFGGSEAIHEYVTILNSGKKNAQASANWTFQIIQLMTKFENVYADFSYCPDPETIENLIIIIQHHPILKTRLMFGSDFIMVMQESRMGGLENYFRQCRMIEPAILSTNARKFLQLS
jgi:predicted TIM-barrel fold metal-dependent hydrolase